MKNAFNFNIFLFLVRSQDIYFIFFMTFGHIKNCLIGKMSLISKCMTLHMLPNISGSKGNLTIKLGQLI